MHTKILPLLLLMCLIIAGCQSGAAPTDSASTGATQAVQGEGDQLSSEDLAATLAAPTLPAAGTQEVSQVATQPADQAAYEGEPLPVERGSLFSGSGACSACHSNLQDQAGVDVSTERLWRASMLANAARDPYWQATVENEVASAPELRGVIEEKCASCHTPMAAVTQHAEGGEVLLTGDGFLDPENPLHRLGMDAVSCTLCHQVEADNLGQPDSFSGGYQVDLDLPAGQRLAYGKFEIDPQLQTMMQAVSGYIPQQADHLGQSELCGTCHDLVTPYLDENGQVAGEFPEQMIYSEWENSRVEGQQTCQGCHMPLASGGVQLSITGGPLRSPFYQHTFTGGNAFMLRVLQANGPALGVTASSQGFAETIANTERMLEKSTATLALEELKIENGVLSGKVRLQSLVGHKLPAGYPSRRAWLHLRVLDGSGQVIFESGALDASGAIQGNANDENPSQLEPHYTQLSTSDQVQIYEAILHDSQGNVTTALLHAASYAKDNRLLPQGFDLAQASPQIAVYGEAASDADFQPGGDVLGLAIDLGAAQGPFTVEAELLYQSVGYRWLENLLDVGASQALHEALVSVPNTPVTVAKAQQEIQP